MRGVDLDPEPLDEEDFEIESEGEYDYDPLNYEEESPFHWSNQLY